jgi:probable HAF family extracellular repeat protein
MTSAGVRSREIYPGGVVVAASDLGILSGTLNDACAVNASGQTVVPAGSGWVLNQASGINDSGQIAGFGTILGQTHAFLITPCHPMGPG